VRAFVASEDGPDDSADEEVVVQAALAILKTWLAEISPQSVGLLSVGYWHAQRRGGSTPRSGML
jgi:hypothetical protein